MRAVVRSVGQLFPTAIVSGRGREKVEQFVQLSELFYAGSHGMDIVGPKIEHTDGTSANSSFQPAAQYRPLIDAVYAELTESLSGIPGASVEHNIFCVSAHFRNCTGDSWLQVIAVVEGIVSRHPTLRMTRGRKVVEIRPQVKISLDQTHVMMIEELTSDSRRPMLLPQMDWHKGTALNHLLDVLGLRNSPDLIAIYLGDDHTDEDAFRTLVAGSQGEQRLRRPCPDALTANSSCGRAKQGGVLVERSRILRSIAGGLVSSAGGGGGSSSSSSHVIALEVEWTSIVGIDYCCPLHADGRLVLEARQLEDVLHCYGWSSSNRRSSLLQPSDGASPRRGGSPTVAADASSMHRPPSGPQLGRPSLSLARGRSSGAGRPAAAPHHLYPTATFNRSPVHPSHRPHQPSPSHSKPNRASCERAISSDLNALSAGVGAAVTLAAPSHSSQTHLDPAAHAQQPGPSPTHHQSTTGTSSSSSSSSSEPHSCPPIPRVPAPSCTSSVSSSGCEVTACPLSRAASLSHLHPPHSHPPASPPTLAQHCSAKAGKPTVAAPASENLPQRWACASAGQSKPHGHREARAPSNPRGAPAGGAPPRPEHPSGSRQGRAHSNPRGASASGIPSGLLRASGSQHRQDTAGSPLLASAPTRQTLGSASDLRRCSAPTQSSSHQSLVEVCLPPIAWAPNTSTTTQPGSHLSQPPAPTSAGAHSLHAGSNRIQGRGSGGAAESPPLTSHRSQQLRSRLFSLGSKAATAKGQGPEDRWGLGIGRLFSPQRLTKLQRQPAQRRRSLSQQQQRQQQLPTSDGPGAPTTRPVANSPGHAGPGVQARTPSRLAQAGSAAQPPRRREVEGIPGAARWTVPSAQHYSRTLVIGFRDPLLPQALRHFVQSDMRLLKLYESGIPSWAVLLPSYGIWYRPWLRTASWLLFILISIVSMACGFYDLYKNVPYLKVVVSAVAARLYLPPSGLLAWLERSTNIRLSILLTYLFSKFVAELFRPVTQSLSLVCGSLTSSVVLPLAGVLHVAGSSVLLPLLSTLRALGGGISAVTAPVWLAATTVAQPLVSFVVLLLVSLSQGVALLLGPLSGAVWMCATSLSSTMVFLCTGLRDLGSSLWILLQLAASGPWAFLVLLHQGTTLAVAELRALLPAIAAVTRAASAVAGTAVKTARSAAPVVGAATRATAAAVQTTANVAGKSQDSVVAWVWLLTELQFAYTSLRTTLLNVINSAKTIINGCVMLCCIVNQHRVSLLLQLRHFSSKQHARLLASLGFASEGDPDPNPLFESPSQELLDAGGSSGSRISLTRHSSSIERSSPSAEPQGNTGADRSSTESGLAGQIAQISQKGLGYLLSKSSGGGAIALIEDELFAGPNLGHADRGPSGRHRVQQPYSAAATGCYNATDILAAVRTAGLQRLSTTRMPSTRDEEYRYTDVSAILKQEFVAPSSHAHVSPEFIAAHTPAESSQSTAVMVDGVLRPELSSLGGLPAGVYVGDITSAPAQLLEVLDQQVSSRGGPFTALNSAAARSVLAVWIPAGAAVEAPLYILHIATDASESGSGAYTLTAPRLLLHAGKGSSCAVVEEFVGVSAAGRYMTCSVAELGLAQGAVLTHGYAQREAAPAFHMRSTLVTQERSSSYNLTDVSLGGTLTRHDVGIKQGGQETETSLRHFILSGLQQLHDLHSKLDLNHPRGTAKQLHKCIVSHSTGKGVFDGNVKVNKLAQKTDAGQLSRNLLLVPRATVNIKPNLQIIADDVKCTHGASISDLAEDELFYFRSRGISAQAARQALVYSFGAEVVRGLKLPSLVTRIQQDVGRTLSAVETLA
ncbi:MAG: hypothetical protein WDW36_002609 [Sanguina aurantia]